MFSETKQSFIIKKWPGSAPLLTLSSQFTPDLSWEHQLCREIELSRSCDKTSTKRQPISCSPSFEIAIWLFHAFFAWKSNFLAFPPPSPSLSEPELCLQLSDGSDDCGSINFSRDRKGSNNNHFPAAPPTRLILVIMWEVWDVRQMNNRRTIY